MRLRLACGALVLGGLLLLPAVLAPPLGAGPAERAPLATTPTQFTYLPSVMSLVAPISPACMSDEAMSFAPNPGATGSLLAVSVTSARASVDVVLQIVYGGASVPLAGPAVTTGGKGYIWTWTFTPTQPGRYDARFYVNQTGFCTAGFVQVTGNPLPTATPTATPLPTATATPTRTPSAACAGDEAVTFAPNPGNTGSPLAVSVTSARASVYVVMQVAYGGAGVPLAGPVVTTGDKGYIWTWTFTPYQPGRYDASLYVNTSDFCAGGFVQVQGAAVATPTPTQGATATPTPPSATPTAAPTAPPGAVVWDWRLTFLNVGISGASVAPGQQYWRVTKGVFENHIEGGGGHSIAVDIRDEWGNRLSLPWGTEVGYTANGGQIPLEWTKWDEAYPVVYGIYGPLGSYSTWITVGGLPSERVYGMGLVASDGTDAPLLAEGGRVHVNYLLTFQRATR